MKYGYKIHHRISASFVWKTVKFHTVVVLIDATHTWSPKFTQVLVEAISLAFLENKITIHYIDTGIYELTPKYWIIIPPNCYNINNKIYSIVDYMDRSYKHGLT